MFSSVEIITLIVVVFLAFIAFITALLSFLRRTESSREWWAEYWQGISTEMVGAIITTLLFTFIVGAAEQSAAEAQQLAQTIQRMSSSVNTVAIAALEDVRFQGALGDGSLNGAVLIGANLQNAQMSNAVMQNVNLTGANLQRVRFLDADLSGSNLSLANLNGTSFFRANLVGVNLTDANLEGANLLGTVFDPTTILPDGTNWNESVEMRRYTNSSDANFWRSTNPDSPAFGGG